jgi:hypothetical protein
MTLFRKDLEEEVEEENRFATAKFCGWKFGEKCNRSPRYWYAGGRYKIWNKFGKRLAKGCF